MRYRLVSGNVWGRDGSLPLGSIVNLSEEKAAVWRAGNCVLEPVDSQGPGDVPADESGGEAASVEPQPAPPAKARRTSRKRTPRPEAV